MYLEKDEYGSFQPEDGESIQRLLLRYNAAFDLHLPHGDLRAWSQEHGWLPKLMSLSNDPEYLRRVLFDNLDIFEIKDFGPCDRWLIAILCHMFPTLRAALEAQLLPAHRTRLQTYPAELELPSVLEQIKAASREDRCHLIGSICRFGTATMLRPFLQGDFDLQEHTEYRIPGLENCHRSYFSQAAEKINMDVMKALVTAGARLPEAIDLLELFCNKTMSQSYGKRDEIPFIDLAFAAFDFESCPQKHEILRLVFRNYSGPKFEDPLLALSYISAGLVQRGCFVARPPMSLDHILVPELFEAIRERQWPVPARKNWILHVINQYKTNLELTEVTWSSFEKGLSFNVTALGLSVHRDELELMQLFLDAGANIEAPIADGRSALELAIENLQKALRRSHEGCDYEMEEKVFRMLIEALKSRGLHRIADQAILEVRQYLPKPVGKVPSTDLQTIGIAKRFRMMLGYLLGQKPAPGEKPFYWAIARWISNIWVITALNIDGKFIRFGFLISFCFIISFEVWAALKDLLSGKRSLVFVLRLVAVAILGLVIALNFQYAESRAYAIV
jgi:hypothetical protein